MKFEKDKVRKMILCPNCKSIQKVKINGKGEVCPLCGCPLEAEMKEQEPKNCKE